VQARLEMHGRNSLPEAVPRGWMRRLIDQFRDFMILVLLGAAVLSGLVGELADTVAILVILVLNAVIGMVQEWRADHAMQALRQLAVPHARVRRNGQVKPSRRAIWFRAMWCCSKLAMACPPICG
jgi:Cation transport ATPase